MLQTTVPLDALRPNPWNPNRMDDRHFEAEVDSIRAFGFIDPITVRQHPDEEGAYQIVDGEHRYRALVHLFNSEEDVPTLPYRDDIPVVLLHSLSTVRAKQLTQVLNETRGEAPRAAMAKLMSEIEAEVGPEEAIRGLAIDLSELDDLLDLARFEPLEPSTATPHVPRPGDAAVDAPSGSGAGRPYDDEGDEDPFLHRIVALVSDDGLAALRAARQALEDQASRGEAPALPSGVAEAWGDVLVRLCKAYADE